MVSPKKSVVVVNVEQQQQPAAYLVAAPPGETVGPSQMVMLKEINKTETVTKAKEMDDDSQSKGN